MPTTLLLSILLDKYADLVRIQAEAIERMMPEGEYPALWSGDECALTTGLYALAGSIELDVTLLREFDGSG